MAAVTKNTCADLFPPAFFQHNAPTSPGLHPLSIAARIANDPELAFGKGADPESVPWFKSAIGRSSGRLNQHFAEWSPEGDFADKYEELVWLACSLYGFSGWRKGEPFKANFYMYACRPPLPPSPSFFFLPEILLTHPEGFISLPRVSFSLPSTLFLVQSLGNCSYAAIWPSLLPTGSYTTPPHSPSANSLQTRTPSSYHHTRIPSRQTMP